MATEILIGTSGWHYPHWRGIYYPPRLPTGKWLAYYASQFETVELNNTFYNLPSERTVAHWLGSVPPGFRFAVKANRFITHRKKLLDPQPALARFIDLLRQFGSALGPVLFQLPPRWHVNPERLACFLAQLPQDLGFVFELRDPSWHCEEIYALLRAHRAAFCIYDIGGFRSPLMVTSDRIYIRLHGPASAYCGNYPARALNGWAAWIRQQEDAREIYVYFDNDEAAYAVRNALALREMLAEKGEAAG